MSIAENKQIAEKFIDEIFSKGILERVSGFVTSDFICHVRGEDITGREILRSDFPLIVAYSLILESISEFNKVATAWIVEGTHIKEFRGITATNKKFETVGVNIFLFEGNKIKEACTFCM